MEEVLGGELLFEWNCGGVFDGWQRDGFLEKEVPDVLEWIEKFIGCNNEI